LDQFSSSNDICCAQFFEDNKYYRAQILEIQALGSNPEVQSEDLDSEKCGKAQVFYIPYDHDHDSLIAYYNTLFELD
jgi:hypothetical protein